jgi:hypothetical protein
VQSRRGCDDSNDDGTDERIQFGSAVIYEDRRACSSVILPDFHNPII